MYLIYIDDAKEHGRAYFSGLMIDAKHWRECALAWRRMLVDLRARRGFRTTRELHATKLLSAHGNYFDNRPTLADCVETHLDVLRTIAAFPTVRLFNACGPLNQQERIFERLLTRVNRTMEAETPAAAQASVDATAADGGAFAMVICDEGKTYDDLLNKLRERNYIRFTDTTVDAPLHRLVEDIVYRKSHDSFMIQAADACVYTLFRREDPLPRLEAAGFSAAFEVLEPILFRAASRNDPHGIIRV